jgi:epoxyqueuosine reductase QueG
MKRFAKRHGADLIGVAPVERFKYAPETHKPEYFLPGARSVVVFAQQILHTTCDQWEKTLLSYETTGHQQLTWMLTFLAYELGRFIERKGYRALPFPASTWIYANEQDAMNSIAEFSHRHAAVAAGLGEFGWCSLLLTPEFGARQRISSIITSAPLRSDKMYDGPKLCDYPTCQTCIQICPVKAISREESKQVSIGGRTYKYAKVDFPRCHWSELGLCKEGGGWVDVKPPEKVTDTALYETREKVMNPVVKRHSTRIGFCGKCLCYCPVGKKIAKRKLERK